jgi:hypothetical protein
MACPLLVEAVTSSSLGLGWADALPHGAPLLTLAHKLDRFLRQVAVESVLSASYQYGLAFDQ